MKIHQLIRAAKRGRTLSRKKKTQLFTTSECAQKERRLYAKLTCINFSLCPYVSNLVFALENSEFFFKFEIEYFQ